MKKREHKRKAGYFWGVLAVMSIWFFVNTCMGKETSDLANAEGIQILKEMETGDVRKLQGEIRELEQKRESETFQEIIKTGEKSEFVVKEEAIKKNSEKIDKVEETFQAVSEKEDVTKAHVTSSSLESAGGNETDVFVEMETETEEETTKADIKQRFHTSIVMGDSITEGLADYNILNSQCVIAGKGLRVSQALEHVDQMVNLAPEKVFLALGLNDLEYYRGDSVRFIGVYRELITDIQNKAPEIEIYVSGILPIQQAAIEKTPEFGCVDAYNQAILEMCQEFGIHYIDNTHLLDGKEEWYQGDGIHMKPEFYSAWMEHLAEGAGI